MKKSSKITLFFGVILAFGTAQAATMRPIQLPFERSSDLITGSVFVNRSILSVESEIYTYFDVSTLLRMWNRYVSDPISLPTDFLKWDGVIPQTNQAVLENIQQLPVDTQTLLLIALVGAESKRSDSFSPTTNEIQSLIATYDQNPYPDETSDPYDVYRFYQDQNEKRKFAQLVIRAANYKSKMGGGLEKNPQIAAYSWTWHGKGKGK